MKKEKKEAPLSPNQRLAKDIESLIDRHDKKYPTSGKTPLVIVMRGLGVHFRYADSCSQIELIGALTKAAHEEMDMGGSCHE